MRAPGGLLDRYVLTRVAAVYGLCVATFILLFLVVDGFSRLDEFIASSSVLEQQGTSVWSVALRFYATKVPRIVSLVGPFMTLFAGIAAVLSLARTNEIVPALMAGRSFHRLLAPVYLFAALATAALFVFEDRIVPGAIRENQILDRMVSKKGRVEVGKIPHLNDGPNRFAAGRWFPKEQKLTDVVCQRYTDPDGRLPVGSLEVKELFYRRHPRTGEVGWFPKDGVLVPSAPGPDGRVLGSVRLPVDRSVAFRFTPEDIDVLAASGEEGIDRDKLAELHRRFPRQHKWTVDLHTRTTRPLSSFVLLLMGIPFVASPEKRSIAWGLGLALGICICYFAADFFFRELGSRGDLNPVVAVWAPIVLFTAAAFALMDRVTT
jgi:lipopolysaccharide export LptBFGC system permease protein LptF